MRRAMKADPGPQMVEIACVAEIRKNSRETLRITLDQYNGLSLVSIRIWERDPSGALVATRSGVQCRAMLLPKLAHAIGRAFAEAQHRDLIGREYRPPPNERGPACEAGPLENGPAAKPTNPESSEYDTCPQARAQDGSDGGARGAEVRGPLDGSQ